MWTNGLALMVTIVASASAFQQLTSTTRSEFLKTTMIHTFYSPAQARQEQITTDVTLPLRYLPVAGCSALLIQLGESYTYYGIIDTGSPFWTAPEAACQSTKNASKKYPTTNEQYGEATGGMVWRSASSVTLQTSNNGKKTKLSPRNGVILGVPASNVIDDTGGIFFGLMAKDDQRPTVLQQLEYRSFCLSFIKKSLMLSAKDLIRTNDPDSLPLFDLGQYGPNLHHYGVLCNSFCLVQTRKQNVRSRRVAASSLKRPVICVIDSGLTGCIFSDSLRDELFSSPEELEGITGAEVHLRTNSGSTIVLQSDQDHWNLSSFKLPWFYNEDTHPHVIALGATFLANTELTVDTQSAVAMLKFNKNSD